MDASQIKALMGRLNKTMTRALEAAAGACIQRTHFEISTEHCLLKLLDQNTSDISVIFSKMNLAADSVRAQLDKSLTQLNAGNQAKPRFSSILLESIASGWNFASLQRGESSIRSGHLLVALLEDRNWVASCGLDFVTQISVEQLVNQFEQLTVGSAEVERVSREQAEAVGSEALAAFTLDLVAQAKAGEMDPVVGRDEEIYQVVDILSRRRKNNPILVGEPGVGKSAIVEGLSLMIAEGKAPPVLDGVAIRTLDLGLLKAGASMKGEFEERLKQVIDAVQTSPTPIILFIDEAHTLIGAGGSAGSGDAANLLKPALARGKLRTIAATTWSEYKKYIEKDPALERRFQLVKIDEPGPAKATMMLRGLKAKYQEHHGVVILDSAVETAAELSDRYISGRQLPDKAIDLLDTASARVRLSLETQPYEITRLENLCHCLRLEIEEKQHQQKITGQPIIEMDKIEADLEAKDLELAELTAKWEAEKAVVQELLALDKSLGEADEAQAEELGKKRHGLIAKLEEMSGDTPLVEYNVTPATISHIVSQWTGIPVGKMVSDELAGILNIQQRLQQRVLGQDHAAERIARAIKASKAKVNNPDAPIGCFMCVGPSGTGKTEMALALADQLFGGERFVIQINMSEYQEKHTLSRLIGSPPGYVGYGEGGVLTEAVRQRPYSVVLLDEVEKGHPDVMNLFYSVFDKGHCADGEGRLIDFKNTIIMMTSNLGSHIIEEMCSEEPWPEISELLEAIRPELNRFLKPALLARMSVIPYTPISEKVMKRIVGLKLRKIALRLKVEHNLDVKAEPALIQGVSDRCRLVEAGARNIDQIFNGELLPLIAEDILTRMMNNETAKMLTMGVDEDGGFTLEFT